LLTRQAELNAALDLDKDERQIAPPDNAEGNVEGNGGGGADDRAASVAVRAKRHADGPRRDEPRGSKERDVNGKSDTGAVRRTRRF
jgi:hypothetical protein